MLSVGPRAWRVLLGPMETRVLKSRTLELRAMKQVRSKGVGLVEWGGGGEVLIT